MAGQTQQILARMEAMLAECGSDKSKVLSATIFATDLGLKKEMDAVWTGFFGDALPARATVGVASLGTPETLIEVTCVATK